MNVKIYKPNQIGPEIEQVRITSDGKLMILFTEPMAPETINSENIKLIDSNNEVISYMITISDKRNVIIESSLVDGASYTLI